MKEKTSSPCDDRWADWCSVPLNPARLRSAVTLFLSTFPGAGINVTVASLPNEPTSRMKLRFSRLGYSSFSSCLRSWLSSLCVNLSSGLEDHRYLEPRLRRWRTFSFLQARLCRMEDENSVENRCSLASHSFISCSRLLGFSSLIHFLSR